MVHQRRTRIAGIPRVTRRRFLQLAGASAVAVAVSSSLVRPAQAARSPKASLKRMGVLTDLTRCIGCRSCEVACNKVNGLPPPERPFSDVSVFNKERKPTAGAFTVVNRYEGSNGVGPVYRKVQCMHCNEPACVSVCPAAAMVKAPEGPTIWDERVCIGCRYCMIACPFNIPAYEYDEAIHPRVRKCTMCYDRVFKKGGKPACVEACPQDVLLFGDRDALLHTARKRILTDPDKYVNHIYGEQEAGGTSWLYLSPAPFEEMGLPLVESTPYGEFTWNFLTAVPVVLILWPLFMIGIRRFGQRQQQIAAEEALKKEASRRGKEGGNAG